MVMLYKPKHKPPPIWFEKPHKNFYTLPEWIEPGLVIGCAHTSISIYGCSTKVEAEGAGKHAMWFNPWKESFPDFSDAQRTETPADRFRELLLK